MTSTEPATNTCIVCIRLRFRRDVQWPTTEVAGHPVHLACRHELEHALEAVANLVDPGAEVLRWASNNQCPFTDLTGLWVRLGLVTSEQAEATEAARAIDSEAFFAAYREAQANTTPSAEEMFEMRAAFGTGVTVIDIITGRPTVL